MQTRWSVIDYVVEEVRRQGHDVTKLDGIQRVGWMVNAWAYVLVRARASKAPDLPDALLIGKFIEPQKNARGMRTCNVRVGPRVCPDHLELPRLMKLLFEQRDALTPLEFYKEFELVHPFVDGNGRTGKILLNWLNNTLLDPIFPPNDLFGEPIDNP